jgi:hypothetical protein
VKLDLPGVLPDEMLQDIEAAYERIKENYRVPDCKKCGSTRINYSWTRKDVIAMAKEVGGFETVVQTGYYAPMTKRTARWELLFGELTIPSGTNTG